MESEARQIGVESSYAAFINDFGGFDLLSALINLLRNTAASPRVALGQGTCLVCMRPGFSAWDHQRRELAWESLGTLAGVH